MYEYHVMGANSINGVQEELDKRAQEGWELVEAYHEASGGNRHVLIFRRRV